MSLDSSIHVAHLADELRAISATALFYCRDPCERVRFAQVRSLAAELLAEVDQRSAGELEQTFQQDSTPRSPLVGADLAIIRRDGRLLLVIPDEDERWRLPGGLVEIGESPSQAAARHALAELGMVVGITGLLAIYDSGYHLDNHCFQVLRHVHSCTVIRTYSWPGKSRAAGWFSAAEIKLLDLCTGYSEIVDHAFCDSRQAFSSDRPYLALGETHAVR